MPKRIALLFALALASSAAFAADQGADEAADQVVCRAVTTCVSPYHPPYTISCETFGASCTWWTVPYQSVQCSGVDFFGRWVNFYYRCF